MKISGKAFEALARHCYSAPASAKVAAELREDHPSPDWPWQVDGVSTIAECAASRGFWLGFRAALDALGKAEVEVSIAD